MRRCYTAQATFTCKHISACLATLRFPSPPSPDRTPNLSFDLLLLLLQNAVSTTTSRHPSLEASATAPMTIAPYVDHPLLPASAPSGQAHILEINAVRVVSEVGSFSTRGHKLCDFIATFLHNLEEHPNALRDFFDPEVKFFKFIRKYEEGEKSHLLPFMISRKKDKVIVSNQRPFIAQRSFDLTTSAVSLRSSRTARGSCGRP